jgi:anaerobic magnesium-protoporphyrin IX monomethyl ester cyclase
VNVLLLSMPDSFEHMPASVIRMPNGALTSLAGNVDPHHRVAVADLILVQRQVRATVERLVREVQPDVVGLSVMTFQRKTARKIINLVRALKQDVRVVVGGYDPSLDTAAYTDEASDGVVDFVVRGEGDVTFRELLRAIENGSGYDTILGLSYREGDAFRHNPDRPPHRLRGQEIRLPNRAARVLDGYTLLGLQADVVETSRGCTFDCSFCSIIEMLGRQFNAYPIERVIADIRDARDRGARAIFLIDDNITLNIRRFEELCRAIVSEGLNDVKYTVQAMTSAMADHGETLAPLMREAGFRYVFLGIENILEEDLQFLHAGAKNTRHEDGHRAGNAAIRAIECIHRNRMYVIGGMIVGNPDDTREAIDANLDFARKYVDWPYIQHPTPYPRTPMTRDFRERDLIINEDVEAYDGTTAVVRTKHLAADEVEFLRWRAERWMKVRHGIAGVTFNPLFMLRQMPGLIAWNFRGSTLKTFLGLEDERKAFGRYRALRVAERRYL